MEELEIPVFAKSRVELNTGPKIGDPRTAKFTVFGVGGEPVGFDLS